MPVCALRNFEKFSRGRVKKLTALPYEFPVLGFVDQFVEQPSSEGFRFHPAEVVAMRAHGAQPNGSGIIGQRMSEAG